METEYVYWDKETRQILPDNRGLLWECEGCLKLVKSGCDLAGAFVCKDCYELVMGEGTFWN